MIQWSEDWSADVDVIQSQFVRDLQNTNLEKLEDLQRVFKPELVRAFSSYRPNNCSK
jgi:hypothetical protein